jgi:hypothetical protein
MEVNWGLLGPEFLSNERRTRTLGLGQSVRSFNDLAVPGLGGIWYGKQLLLSVLGVAVAEAANSQGARVKNIEAANAIEALACWLAFKRNGWHRDSRLRGRTKLQSKADFRFQRVRQRSFYVTQPMRMASVQALPALGLVESDSARFNSFRCSDAGRDFIETAFQDCRPYNRTIVDHLSCWAQRKDDRVDSDALWKALSPLNRLPDVAIPMLRERLLQRGDESLEDTQRRYSALAWVETIRKTKPGGLTWEQRPDDISEAHWHDLHAGALLFTAREAAIAVLDAAEMHIGNEASGISHSLGAQVPESLKSTLDELKRAAEKYLAVRHSDTEAKRFCNECVSADESSILRSLVDRDGHVLRLVGDEIKPGPAFRGSATPIAAEEGETQGTLQKGMLSLPEGISYRVRNLYLLNLDMNGELDSWLISTASGEVT